MQVAKGDLLTYKEILKTPVKHFLTKFESFVDEIYFEMKKK